MVQGNIDMHNFSSDSPVYRKDEDQFSRWEFSKRIAGVISEREDPSSITIGLYAPWGNGKTSVLNFIESSLTSNEKVIVVRFNPWLFESVESLLFGFFECLALALDKKLINTGEQFKDILKKAAPGIASLGGVEALGNSIGSFLNGPSLNDLRERIENVLEESKKRVLIMVDDVDRLEKSEIQAIFKLVKLTADFKYTAYILAFDKDIVAAALSENYLGANKNSGEQFLEKIIQVPLHLPLVPEIDLQNFCFLGVDTALQQSKIILSERQEQEFVRNFTLAFSEEMTTPRKAKLYGNILLFSLPILKDEVNPVDLMLVEGIRVFVPELYEVIRNNKESFVGIFGNSYYDDAKLEREQIKNLINPALKLERNEASGAIELLKNLFPKLENIYGNTYFGSDFYAEWNKEQRVCASDYFDRYFTYSISKGDFSDKSIASIIGEIESANDLSMDNNPLNKFLNNDNAKLLIRKLRQKASSLTSEQSESLALAICLLDNRLPNPISFSPWETPFVQAAILINSLVENLEKERRVSFAVELIQKASTVSFKMEIFKWLRKEDKERPEKESFNNDEVALIGDKLGKILAEYIEQLEDVTKQSSDILSELFYLLNKYSKQENILKHLEKIKLQDTSFIVRLLDSYTSIAWSLDSGISHQTDFERRQYDSVTEVINGGFILSAIKDFLGDIPQVTEEFPYGDGQEDRSIVLNQFLWLHNYKMQEDAKIVEQID